jgi:hypothetical protein
MRCGLNCGRLGVGEGIWVAFQLVDLLYPCVLGDHGAFNQPQIVTEVLQVYGGVATSNAAALVTLASRLIRMSAKIIGKQEGIKIYGVLIFVV